jgi:hypothetical protein
MSSSGLAYCGSDAVKMITCYSINNDSAQCCVMSTWTAIVSVQTFASYVQRATALVTLSYCERCAYTVT